MFPPKHFLSLAEELKDTSKDSLFESRIRASIGRSYYGIFLETRSKVERLANKMWESRKNIHELLISELKGSGDKQIAEFGTNLDSLRQYRHQADYRIRVNISKNVAEISYTLANKLFVDLANLPETEFKKIFQATP